MIREHDNLPLYTDIYSMSVVTVRRGGDKPDKYFEASVGQQFPKSGMKVTRIVWNDNILKEKGINRYEVFAENREGAEILWQWFDNPVSVNVTCSK